MKKLFLVLAGAMLVGLVNQSINAMRAEYTKEEIQNTLNNKLLDAVKANNYDEAKSAIERGANVDARLSLFSGYASVLQIAAHKGFDEITKLLLKNHADVNKQDKLGETALHFAAAGGHLKISKLLIKHKANINMQSLSGMTPLMFALRFGHANVARLLIHSGADVRLANALETTTLDFAKNSKITSIQALIPEIEAKLNR